MAVAHYLIQIERHVPAATLSVQQRGAIVNAAQAAINTVTVHSPHEFKADDRFLYAKDRTNVSAGRMFTVSSVTATTITFSGATFTFPDKAMLVPLGADTGGTQNTDGTWTKPEYDGSTVAAYKDPAASSAWTNARVDVTPGYEASFWADEGLTWVLVVDTNNDVVRVYEDMGSEQGGAAGPVSLVFNAEDYGAVDGGTVDSTIGVQAAINAAGTAGGGTVYLPGWYKTTSVVNIAAGQGRITLLGRAYAGTESGILAAHAGIGLKVDAQECQLENFEINGNDQTSSCILYANAKQTRTTRVKAAAAAGNGFEIDPDQGTSSKNANLLFFEQCQSVSNGENGLEVIDSTEANSTGITLLNCSMSSNTECGAIVRNAEPKVIGGNYSDNDIGISLGESGDSNLTTKEGMLLLPHMESNTTYTLDEGSGQHFMMFLREDHEAGRNRNATKNTIVYVDNTNDRLHTEMAEFHETSDGGDVATEIRNVATSGSSDETVTLNMCANAARNGASIVCGRDGEYNSAAQADANLTFKVALNDTLTDRIAITSAGKITLNGTVVETAVGTFGAADATPPVSGGNFFITGGADTYTDFDLGVVGQTITILAAHAATVSDNAAILLDGNQNFVMAVGDTLTLHMFNDQVWNEVGRQDQTGRVVGPASASNNAIVRFDGTTGRIIQDYTSGAPTVSDTGAVYINGELELDGDFNHDGTNFGVRGATPVAIPTAYTQTYATATRTHANPTAATLTDSTSGSADQTLSEITDQSETTDNSVINDNFAELADEVNKLVADLANLKQVVNSMIDDRQADGLAQ